MKCKVCGKEFEPDIQKQYTGIIGVTEYDCFDCPGCGCQNIAGNRIPAKRSINVEELREYVCDHICVHAAEDSDYLEQRCKECRLDELTKI